MPSDLEKQIHILREGAVDLIAPAEFESEISKSLKEKKPLRIKYGADPSSADLHLGHTVPLRKLRTFQEFGHTIVFIIGDFTARIGDPTHRSETRPMLSREEVARNAKTYQEQVFKILDPSRTEVRYNSEWLEKMTPADFLHLTGQYTVARLLERDDFQKRYRANLPIALVEFLYPLLQGYDSVIVRSDLELGGTDQKFNLLVGRELQKIWNQKPQMILTLPLLEGTDGVQKMSKSLNNAIAIQDAPREMFGKLMSVPDKLIPKYIQYVAALPADQAAQFLKEFPEKPRETKAALAEHIVKLFHGADEAGKSREEFDRIFRDKGLPSEIQNISVPTLEWDIVTLLKETGLVESKSEARRLIEQGGVKINQDKITDAAFRIKLTEPVILQCGKRKFAKVAYHA